MRGSFRVRIAAGMLGYALVCAAGILGLGHVANEGVERVIWHTLLDGEIEQLLRRREVDPEAPLPGSGNLHAYAVDPAAAATARLPAVLARLGPGLHEEVELEGREFAVMVRDAAGLRYYMAMDIDALEANERTMTGWLLAAAAAVAAALASFGWWLSGKLLRPLHALALEIDRVRPATPGERVSCDAPGDGEIAAMGQAVNALLERIDGFVARERTFVTTASHELRTPIATISGAVDLALTQPELPDEVRKPLARIQAASRDIDQLIQVLLVLAKSPERIMQGASRFALEDMVRAIVAEHQPLTRGKSLSLHVGSVQPTWMNAPPGITRIAIANLVRNAVQHSDHGAIEVGIEPAGVLRVVDPGSGPDLAATEVSRRYAASVRRGDNGYVPGIGLELLARICAHLHWSLELRASGQGGTLAVLDLRASRSA